MKKHIWGSVLHQKQVAKLIGYDFSKWNPDDKEQVNLLLQKATSTLLSGKDTNGNCLSSDDLSLLSTITGSI
jgi:hypothetical protein